MIQVIMWTDGIKKIIINVENIKLYTHQHVDRQRLVSLTTAAHFEDVQALDLTATR